MRDQLGPPLHITVTLFVDHLLWPIWHKLDEQNIYLGATLGWKRLSNLIRKLDEENRGSPLGKNAHQNTKKVRWTKQLTQAHISHHRLLTQCQGFHFLWRFPPQLLTQWWGIHNFKRTGCRCRSEVLWNFSHTTLLLLRGNHQEVLSAPPLCFGFDGQYEPQKYRTTCLRKFWQKLGLKNGKQIDQQKYFQGTICWLKRS